jgi:capsular exopolysaccharide synthesis family protein
MTSPSAGEGKTTIIANLGVCLAQAGQRVIIACCDLRRPRLHEFFGLDNAVGFTSVLLGQMPAFAALQPVAGEPNLSILASGPLPSNPSELLSTDRAAEVLAALRGEADIVLIDSPPLLPVTDAAVLTRLVDGTVLVVTVGSTTRKQISQALEVLGQVDAPLIGTVLNNVSAEGSYYYKYEPDPTPRRQQPLPLRGNGKLPPPPIPRPRGEKGARSH